MGDIDGRDICSVREFGGPPMLSQIRIKKIHVPCLEWYNTLFPWTFPTVACRVITYLDIQGGILLWLDKTNNLENHAKPVSCKTVDVGYNDDR